MTVPRVRFAAVRALILSEISVYTDGDEQEEDACTDELMMMRAIVRDLAAMKAAASAPPLALTRHEQA